MFWKRIKENIKAKRAIKDLRKALSHFKEVDNISDDDLEMWVKEHITRLGTNEIAAVHSVPSYIEVKEAAPKPVTERDEIFRQLEAIYGLSEQELSLIYNKCGSDIKKTSYVVQMMALTFDTDDNIIANYQYFFDQLRYKLKLL